MTRDSSPFQKSSALSSSGSAGTSPRPEIATVWRRSEDNKSSLTSSPDSDKKPTLQKNVTFDPNVKETLIKTQTPVSDDEISEEELLRQGIHLARRLSADGPRREFNWDEEDDDTPWTEMLNTPVFPTSNTPASTTDSNLCSNGSTSIPSTSSQSIKTSVVSNSNSSNFSSSKRSSGPQKPLDSSSQNTWKIPPQIQIVPISKQIQELNDKKHYQHAHHNYNNTHNNFDSGRSAMSEWHNRNGPHDTYLNGEIDNRYRYSDYEKRYRPEQPAPPKQELFNEHNGQIEAYHHRNRGGRMGSGTDGNTAPARNIHANGGMPSNGSVGTYDRSHSFFSVQTGNSDPPQQRNGSEYVPYRRGSSYQNQSIGKHAHSDESTESGERPKSFLEVQEELMRISRENALKRKEEEARLERERLIAIKKKAEERLANLEMKKTQHELQEKPKAEKSTDQPQAAAIESNANQGSTYSKRSDDGKRSAAGRPNGSYSIYNSNKPRRGSNFNNDENAAISAVKSLISDEGGDQRHNKPKLWTNNGLVAGSELNTHARNSHSYSNSPGTNSSSSNSTVTPNLHSQGHSHHNSTGSIGRSVSDNAAGVRSQHSHTKSGQEDIWGSGHRQLPQASDADFWRPFSSGLQPVQGNVYPQNSAVPASSSSPPSSSSTEHRQGFTQQGLPTSSSASSSQRIMSSWGSISNAPSSTDKNTTKSSSNQHSTKGQYDQPTYGHKNEAQTSWNNSHTQSQRSVSMPNSPMSPIHLGTHQQQSSQNSENSGASKLIAVRPSTHDSSSMSRGISRFFPIVNSEEKDNGQRSPVEPMAVMVSSSNVSSDNAKSASQIRNSTTLSASGINTAPSKSGYGQQQNTSQLGNTTTHRSYPTKAPNVATSISNSSDSTGSSFSGSRNVITSSNGDSHMSDMIFHGQGSPTGHTGNIMFSPLAVDSNSVAAYSPSITDGSLFGEMANQSGSPRISLPPSQSQKGSELKYSVGTVHQRTVSQNQNVRPAKQVNPAFKSSVPSINSIEALQTTIAEKLGSKTMADVLHNEPASQRSNIVNVTKDLPIPISPIVLSENIPPFYSSGQKRVGSIEKVFTPQAHDRGNVYTYPEMKGTRTEVTKKPIVAETCKSEPVEPLRKPQSFADAVVLSLEAEKRQQAAMSAKTATKEAQKQPAVASLQSDVNREAFEKVSKVKKGEDKREKRDMTFAEFLKFSKELVTQSSVCEFESFFSGLQEKKEKEFAVAMPYYTSSKYNPDIMKDTQYSECGQISDKWDEGLIIPHDEVLCTLFLWCEGQSVAYNREFKPRTTSRVALLIPGNGQKILTLYRISNLESITSAPGNGMSLFEMGEKAKGGAVTGADAEKKTVKREKE